MREKHLSTRLIGLILLETVETSIILLILSFLCSPILFDGGIVTISLSSIFQTQNALPMVRAICHILLIIGVLSLLINLFLIAASRIFKYLFTFLLFFGLLIPAYINTPEWVSLFSMGSLAELLQKTKNFSYLSSNSNTVAFIPVAIIYTAAIYYTVYIAKRLNEKFNEFSTHKLHQRLVESKISLKHLWKNIIKFTIFILGFICLNQIFYPHQIPIIENTCSSSQTNIALTLIESSEKNRSLSQEIFNSLPMTLGINNRINTDLSIYWSSSELIPSLAEILTGEYPSNYGIFHDFHKMKQLQFNSNEVINSLNKSYSTIFNKKETMEAPTDISSILQNIFLNTYDTEILLEKFLIYNIPIAGILSENIAFGNMFPKLQLAYLESPYSTANSLIDSIIKIRGNSCKSHFSTTILNLPENNSIFSLYKISLDKSLEKLTQSLNKINELDNTIFIFINHSKSPLIQEKAFVSSPSQKSQLLMAKNTSVSSKYIYNILNSYINKKNQLFSPKESPRAAIVWAGWNTHPFKNSFFEIKTGRTNNLEITPNLKNYLTRQLYFAVKIDDLCVKIQNTLRGTKYSKLNTFSECRSNNKIITELEKREITDALRKREIEILPISNNFSIIEDSFTP